MSIINETSFCLPPRGDDASVVYPDGRGLLLKNKKVVMFPLVPIDAQPHATLPFEDSSVSLPSCPASIKPDCDVIDNLPACLAAVGRRSTRDLGQHVLHCRWCHRDGECISMLPDNSNAPTWYRKLCKGKHVCDVCELANAQRQPDSGTGHGFPRDPRLVAFDLRYLTVPTQ